MRQKIILSAVFAVVLGILGLVAPDNSLASTSGCTSLGAVCGDNVNVFGNTWAASGGTLNATVVVSPGNTTSRGEDFYRTSPSSGVYQYEYAPGGVHSGFCASDPGGGVSSDPSPDGIILRSCNALGYQYFRVGTAGSGGNQLVDVNTGLPVQTNGAGSQLAGGGSYAGGSYWTWNGGSGGGGGGGQMPPPPGYSTKIFEDQFTGTTLDSSKWVTYVGEQGIVWNDHGYLPPPYSGFNEPGATGQAMYAPSQDTVNNGLTIIAQRNTNQYSGTYPWISGTINTEGKFSLPTNSSWYVQAKFWVLDTSQGMWPSMWFLPGVPGTASNELDGFEGGFDELSGVPANQTVHYDFFSNQGQRASEQNIGTDISQGYHIFGVAFVPGKSITWYLDGVQKFQVLASSGVTIAAEPYEIMLNLQVAAGSTSGFHTVPNSGTPTSYMKIAEVQAYVP